MIRVHPIHLKNRGEPGTRDAGYASATSADRSRPEDLMTSFALGAQSCSLAIRPLVRTGLWRWVRPTRGYDAGVQPRCHQSLPYSCSIGGSSSTTWKVSGNSAWSRRS